MQSQSARQTRLVLYTMYKREYEIDEIFDLLEIWIFKDSEQVYKKGRVSDNLNLRLRLSR